MSATEPFEPRVRYFIDANVWLYAAGDRADLQTACLACLDAIREAGGFSVTSVGVLEEVWFLAYRQCRNPQVVQRLLRQIEQGVGWVVPVGLEDYHLAQRLFRRVRTPLSSTKDYVHVACMLNQDIRWIVSRDPDFDRFHAIRRVDPLRVAAARSPASGGTRTELFD